MTTLGRDSVKYPIWVTRWRQRTHEYLTWSDRTDANGSDIGEVVTQRSNPMMTFNEDGQPVWTEPVQQQFRHYSPYRWGKYSRGATRSYFIVMRYFVDE